ncbi:MAG TPA: HEAT repeat domain-containing protein [Gemmataceae bacterium]|nr:HEAT repeat domain-containing protein [Gemmataceae bacterium]
MKNCTPYRLRGPCPASRTAYRRFRLLSLLLLMLGILAGSDLTGLHAQKPGDFEKTKDKDMKKMGETNPAKMPPKPAELIFSGGTFSAPRGFVQRFQEKIDPKTPLKDLLPPPPMIERIAEPVQANDLSRVPEVQFEAHQSSANAEAIAHIAHQIAKINHLNDRKADGFIEALRGERPDLTGLPFAMGDACRTKGERSKQFSRAVATVRRALQPGSTAETVKLREQDIALARARREEKIVQMERLNSGTAASGSLVTVRFSAVAQAELPPPATFWDQYQTLCLQEDKEQKQANRARQESVICARIAALSQILLPMAEMHPGLVKYLSSASHIEATRALARLAIFSADDNVRKAAVEALKIRRERDYTEILVNGLRYPWPAVARRAAEAIVKLERNDLVPQLIDVLEKPDPRVPETQEIKGKSVPVVRELVRVNHHRSCLLCHAPGNTGKVSADAVTAEVPIPGQPLNPLSGGYNTSRQEILVRVDVTYLRQDFSALQEVADANPWPEMQRFDFLVRTRVLNDEEATAYREKLKPREAGEFSPYQRAALAALRELTGRDTEPTPEAWRRLLKLPAETKRKSRTP